MAPMRAVSRYRTVFMVASGLSGDNRSISLVVVDSVFLLNAVEQLGVVLGIEREPSPAVLRQTNAGHHKRELESHRPGLFVEFLHAGCPLVVNAEVGEQFRLV